MIRALSGVRNCDGGSDEPGSPMNGSWVLVRPQRASRLSKGMKDKIFMDADGVGGQKSEKK